MPHIRVENNNFRMGGKILFWVDEILLFFQFRVEISTQDTKKAAMTFYNHYRKNLASPIGIEPTIEL